MNRYLIIFTLLLTQTSISQTKKYNIDEVYQDVLGQWTLLKMESEGKGMNIDLDIQVEFFDDRTLNTIANGKESKEFWEVVEVENQIYFDINKNKKSKLISINDKSLIISREFQMDLESDLKETITYFFTKLY